MKKIRRTRFAPSPTGYMHVGNLRSALYTWLIAKSKDGKFILRIEDTDQERIVEGAVQIIYDTLSACHLQHDEGPDIGGPYGPYVQSERLAMYKPYAERLVQEGKAYRCFCAKEDAEVFDEEEPDQVLFGYNRHCRNLSEEEIAKNLAEGKPYVIRQKMPLEGKTGFHDIVYGEIVVDNAELEDQILLKSDGFPTYNFANVIDDHEMGITHVVRGSEYLSSTPKYNLLYEALGFAIPEYVHLPLILGTDGRKLSKRHGATSFQDLVAEGYLVDAIINYMAFLGWSPGEDTREIFSLEELREIFDERRISKAPAVFDYEKLAWYNAHYIKEMLREDFENYLRPASDAFFGEQDYDFSVLCDILQSRIQTRAELPEMLAFFKETTAYTKDLFYNKKQKLDPELSALILSKVLEATKSLADFSKEALRAMFKALGEEYAWKTGQVMTPPRLALSGQNVTPGGTTEIMLILGKEESLTRMEKALELLNA